MTYNEMLEIIEDLPFDQMTKVYFNGMNQF